MTKAWNNAEVFAFDVEGTLVDAMMPTLRCWRETLLTFDQDVPIDALHRLSGLDGKLMLAQLLPQVSATDRDAMIEQQGTRYRREFLTHVKPFPGVRELFEELRRRGRQIALATDCQKDELRHYLDITGISDLVGAFACGDDVECGKPSPDIIRIALDRIDAKGRPSVMIGDTVFDAKAAGQAGIASVGLMTGHIDEESLRLAGCEAVFRDVSALHAGLSHVSHGSLP
jgi:HAD superfamily hydrolase (TIGR01549 family)